MATKYNFAQLTNSDEARITKKTTINYKTIPVSSAGITVTTTDLGMVTKSFGQQRLNCFESVCNYSARDASTITGTTNYTIPLPYATTSIKEGALAFQFATSVDLLTAVIKVRAYVTGSPANYNEYIIEAVKYNDSNLTYSAIIQFSDAEGTTMTPTSVGGTGLGATGTMTVEFNIADTGVLVFTSSLFPVLYIADSSELECEYPLLFGCIDDITYNSALETVAKRCFSSSYSTAVVEEELTMNVKSLSKNFMLLDPRAVYTKSTSVGVEETATGTLTAKTVNGINYGAYQLPTTFAQGCDVTRLELPSCGELTDMTKLCINNASQPLLSTQYIIYEESANNTNTYYFLVDDIHVGSEGTFTYVVNTTTTAVTFDDSKINTVSYDFAKSFYIDGTDGNKQLVNIAIADIKPTTFPTLNLSGTDEVTNVITIKFKRGDVVVTGL